jgi:hypothetical protein
MGYLRTSRQKLPDFNSKPRSDRRNPISFSSQVSIRLICCALLFSLAVLPPLAAQEVPSGAGSPFSLGMGFGVEGFGDRTYQRLSLMPELTFGKFGIAFDLFMRFNFEDGTFDLREEDWVPEKPTFKEIAGLYLQKFRYIRYGFKGEPLYVKFGSIDDATLGNGFIMGAYANTLFLPETRIFGLSFDLDGALFNFPIIGLETHIGDLSAFDVIGGRFYIRPLALTDVPIFKNLEIGTTVAADTDPFRYADSSTKDAAELVGIDTDEARMWALGGDIRIPLLDTSVITLDTFGDIATLKAKSLGGAVGIGGRLVKIVIYEAQIRLIGDDFLPVYFDTSYDISRSERYSLIEGDLSTPGFTGWLGTLGLSILNDRLVLLVTVEGPFGKVDDNEDNFLNYPHLRGILLLKEGLIPGFFFDISYEKMLLREFADLGSPEGAIARATLNYRTGPALISFFYQMRFEEDDWESPETTSGLQTSIQLF